jgi:hypothetical protein
MVPPASPGFRGGFHNNFPLPPICHAVRRGGQGKLRLQISQRVDTTAGSQFLVGCSGQIQFALRLETEAASPGSRSPPADRYGCRKFLKLRPAAFAEFPASNKSRCRLQSGRAGRLRCRNTLSPWRETHRPPGLASGGTRLREEQLGESLTGRQSHSATCCHVIRRNK